MWIYLIIYTVSKITYKTVSLKVIHLKYQEQVCLDNTS